MNMNNLDSESQITYPSGNNIKSPSGVPMFPTSAELEADWQALYTTTSNGKILTYTAGNVPECDPKNPGNDCCLTNTGRCWLRSDNPKYDKDGNLPDEQLWKLVSDEKGDTSLQCKYSSSKNDSGLCMQPYLGYNIHSESANLGDCGKDASIIEYDDTSGTMRNRGLGTKLGMYAMNPESTKPVYFSQPYDSNCLRSSYGKYWWKKGNCNRSSLWMNDNGILRCCTADQTNIGLIDEVCAPSFSPDIKGESSSICTSYMTNYCKRNNFDDVCMSFLTNKVAAYVPLQRAVGIKLIQDYHDQHGFDQNDKFWYETAADICNANPGLCDDILDSSCANVTRDQLGKDARLQMLCGCHLKCDKSESLDKTNDNYDSYTRPSTNNQPLDFGIGQINENEFMNIKTKSQNIYHEATNDRDTELIEYDDGLIDYNKFQDSECQYIYAGIIPDQCDPVCNVDQPNQTTIRRGRNVGEDKWETVDCDKVTTCIIDNVVVEMINSSFPNMSYANVCGNCGSGSGEKSCFCRIDGVTEYIKNSKIGNIDLGQYCGQCLDGNGKPLPGGCNGNVPGGGGGGGVPSGKFKLSWWEIGGILGVILIICVIIISITWYYHRAPSSPSQTVSTSYEDSSNSVDM